MDDVVSVMSPFGEVVATGMFDGVRNSIAIDLYIDGVGTIPIVVVEVDIDETEVPALVVPWCENGNILEYIAASGDGLNRLRLVRSTIPS